MRKLLLGSAAALSLLAVPAVAQLTDAPEGSTNSVADKRSDFDMNEQQRVMYNSWPVETRTSYDTWDPMYRQYYWDLTPEQQRGYLLLTDEQRAQLQAMTEAQRTSAWTSIVEQMNAQAGTATAQATTSAGAMGANPNVSYQSSPTAQAVAAPASEYPICSATVTDSCINPWEAGRRGRGVNRPLGHWPGRPASEM